MDFLGSISAGGYSLFGYILPFLLVLTIVVFFHELGHYLVAKWCKVDVEAFSVGFGPELIGFNDRAGTRWKICAVPLGGYVKFAGDANAASVPDHDRLRSMNEEEKAGSFEHKPVSQRAAVVAAGPIANFILAILIFAGSFYFLGRYVTDPVVSEVVAESAAEEAGFVPGDIIRRVDGREVSAFSEIPRLVAPKHGIEMTFQVERDGEPVDLLVTPKLKEQEDRFGNVNRQGVIGIISRSEEANLRFKEYGLGEAVSAAVGETVYIVQRTFQYLGGIITGRESADQLSGPLGIAQVSGQVATLGWAALISLAAVLSVSIGLLNLFPVPMLDGGHLVFYAYEALVGKPVGERAQEISFRIGFVLLISLMLFATHNDIVNRFGWFS
ncbi:MAG: RIP metalloprotease RseP [Pseudomonadota bacterium]